MNLATKLRNNGIDAILDQWELAPGDDLTHFMERHLAAADKVVMVCSDNYVAKANSGAGGVGYEKMIMTAEYLKRIDSNKVIPLIRQKGSSHVPTFLQTKLYIDFSQDEGYEYSYDELVRTIHNSPLFVKPVVGNNPFTPPEQLAPNKTGDSLLKLMQVVIKDFDRGDNWTSYRLGLIKFAASRVYYDNTIEKAIEMRLIVQDAHGDIRITEAGKQYAIVHKLI